MSTNEALEIYPAFAKKVFGKPKSELWMVLLGGRFTYFNATTLELEIKKIIVNKLKQNDPHATGDEMMFDRHPKACKT
jgi:hypothetical protein